MRAGSVQPRTGWSCSDSPSFRVGRTETGLGVQLQVGGLSQRLRVREALKAVECLYRDTGDVDVIGDALGLRSRMSQMVGQLSGGWQRRWKDFHRS